MAKTCLRGSVAVLLSIGLAGFVCARQGQQISTPIAGARQTAEFTAPAPDRPRLAERNPRYKINRSDILNLSFPLSPEFNQSVTVQPDGYITLQGAGSICILGMTVPETSEAIKKAYAKVLHEPIVDVDLKDFQRAYFIVPLRPSRSPAVSCRQRRRRFFFITAPRMAGCRPGNSS